MINSLKCTSCGKFIRVCEGVSWAQNWSYDMIGEPDLHDPIFQCVPCTEKNGKLNSNCGNPKAYSGIIAALNEK